MQYRVKPSLEEIEELAHYGTPRHSGRYPWGSGENPYQRTGTILSRYYEYQNQGLSEVEIAEAMGTTTTKLRPQIAYAKNQSRIWQIDRARSLKEDGLSNADIGKAMGGLNESTIRSLLNENSEARTRAAVTTAKKLKEIVDEKGIVDVGPGVERELGVSRNKLDEALYQLEVDGYLTEKRRLNQVTNPNQKTTLKLLCKPGTEKSDIYDVSKIGAVSDYAVSYDDGETFHKPFEYPSSMDPKRLKIRYAEEGGLEKDGVIELRRGVKDLSLGESNYAQVRIMVGGDRYLKGMAVYSDDMPDGVDVIFNTNKSSNKNWREVLKPVKTKPDGEIDRDNPFGSLIKEHGGQSFYDDPKGDYIDGVTGKKQSLSLINKRADEGDWGEWAKKLPSQFLGKQSIQLIHKQLNLAKADADEELAEINALTNPTIKKVLLKKFADGCDKDAVTLKAAALPRQRYQVILPLTSIGENEVYAPNYKDGESVALVRFPHGGIFEIPVLKVNNKNPEGKRVLGTNPLDAVGISSKVAERLSGADFDGDTVVVIPTGGKIKILSKEPLKGLKNPDGSWFDPKMAYPEREGMKVMKDTQKQMGVISNLITDMTLKGATDDELARAVRHSMVVIDAEKHHLDYKRSEEENGIAALKRKYQGTIDENGRYHEGASTLLSLAKSEVSVPKRQGSAKIDPETGEQYWTVTKDLYYNEKKKDKTTGEWVETGKVKMRTQPSTRMAETKDAYTLVSDMNTKQEQAYADYANHMKSLANRARKDMLNAGKIEYKASAKAAYKDEVDTLMAKLAVSEANRPKERRAQILANNEVKAKIAEDPSLSDRSNRKMLKKVSQQALVRARNEVGAKRTPIKMTDREWEAIQAGAISENVLRKIIDSMDIDELRARATPRQSTELSQAKINLIKARAASGYSTTEIAESLNISASTVSKYLK